MNDNQHSDTATGSLREEHQLILKVVDVLDSVVVGPSEGGTTDFTVIDGCVSFFRLFVDACHHAKEEDLLFPELIEHGIPGDEGPIAVMLSEHQQGRLYVRAMAESLPEARGGDGGAEQVLLTSARRYIDLIRAHIDKEDGILFEMADNIVVGEDCKSLCAGYETACEGRFEGKTKADLEAMAARLTAG